MVIPPWQECAAAFGALFVLDLVWAKYTAHVIAKRAFWSASYAAGLICLSGGAAVLYTQSPALLIPAALGAWAGTFVAVRWWS